MNRYQLMINEFLHNSGYVEKGRVGEQEWWLVNGSIKVQIFLHPRKGDTDLIVAANLLRYARSFPEFENYLLKLNGSFRLRGVSLGFRNHHLVASYIRPVEGLDPEELEWIITSVALVADELDDFLVNRFQLE